MEVMRVLKILNQIYPDLEMYRVTTTPFRTLIATLISQRARDDQTVPVAEALFKVADTPQAVLALSRARLEKILRPSGKYRQNARRIQDISKILIADHDGKVPANEEKLLALPGVGRKTANIVLSHSFKKDAIAVDTHVHRITNRLGWVKTQTPEETEKALQKIIPKKYWRIVNRVFVRHGQELCVPQSPFCSTCPIFEYCKRVNVKRSR